MRFVQKVRSEAFGHAFAQALFGDTVCGRLLSTG